MLAIKENRSFRAAYERMAQVRLNPRRHTAPDARAHSEAVAALAVQLGRLNNEDTDLLENLGFAHDIGKVASDQTRAKTGGRALPGRDPRYGSSHPEHSVKLLTEWGITQPDFLALVKWHDTALPWFRAAERGQPPSDKAWRRLVRQVDLSLLVIFMVADRVDSPGGWRRNAPQRWFLAEARARGLLRDLVLDLPHHPSEVSAGALLVDDGRALLIRVRNEGFEIPKGGIEWDETSQQAALRELTEEAGVTGALEVSDALGSLSYPVDGYLKKVDYFSAAGSFAVGKRPSRTRERRWITEAETRTIPLVNESLRPLLLNAF